VVEKQVAGECRGAHIGELYGVEISPELVSAMTDAALEEAAAWQN
jgi:putative transposase